MNDLIRITRRQKEICKLLLFTNPEIAERLVIALSTVKGQVHTMMQRTESTTRTEILIKCLKAGVIKLDDVILPNGNFDPEMWDI